MRYVCALLAAVALTTGITSSLRAECTTDAVSNLDLSFTSSAGIEASPNYIAVPFTTGPAASELVAIRARIRGQSPTAGDQVVARLYADGGTTPGGLLDILNAVTLGAYAPEANVRFTSNGYALAANTKYWVSFQYLPQPLSSGNALLRMTSTPTESSTLGWTIGDSSYGVFFGNGYTEGAGLIAVEVTCPLSITSWKSIRTAGSLGEVGINLDPSLPIETASIESRRGGVRIIEATLSAPVASINPSQAIVLGQVISPSGVAGPELSYSPSSVSLVGGNKIRLTFADPLLPERARFKIDLSMVVTVSGDADCNVRVLGGDVNGTGGADLGDALAVKAHNGQPVTPENAKYDLNNDGAINLIDVALAKSLIQPTAVDCVVSDWSPWSTCSDTCGGGTQTRTRTVLTEAAGGGAACPNLIETQPCNTQPCPIPCVVSAWSPWSDCSLPCGGGQQIRTRTVVRQPAYGGTACPNLVDTQTCNSQPCPVDCVVSAWSPWSACSATCGGGTQTRTRTITTYPMNGGAACPNLVDTTACNTQPCPVDCVYTDWGPWSACSAGCGGGIQYRTRGIAVFPANGGAPCNAPFGESQSCNEQPCP